jgi:hypothetical protein
LDRAAQAVELAMARAGNEHWGRIVQKFDELWQQEDKPADKQPGKQPSKQPSNDEG